MLLTWRYCNAIDYLTVLTASLLRENLLNTDLIQ